MRSIIQKAQCLLEIKKTLDLLKSGAGMTRGAKLYRRPIPGSKLKTAVTGKVKPGSKAAKRRKSYCADHSDTLSIS